MNSSLDGLLTFLHYEMNIFRDGMLRYRAASGTSPKSAVADSLAQFLVGEQKDFHEYFRHGNLSGDTKVM